ncbi:thymidylate synthase [Streptomyces stelliscabiei]|uniref:thymidylate synthase n=1 Tax=Streptomyces stelliscabiei TaxID=146820 RepID=UPI002FF0607C
MTHLTADSMAELFSGAITLAKSGEKVSPRGMATREVRDVHLLLTQPRARLLYAPPARIVNPAFAVAETVWHLSGSDDPWIFDYNARLRQYADDGVLLGAYGPRMRNWGGKVDQLARVVEILKEDPDSRRALIQLYDPAQDAAGHKDVPCTLGFRFHLRDSRLHMATMMRGQDVWIGMPYDVFFYTVLHELVAGWLDAELGEFHLHVGSLHIYDEPAPTAEPAPAVLPRSHRRRRHPPSRSPPTRARTAQHRLPRRCGSPARRWTASRSTPRRLRASLPYCGSGPRGAPSAGPRPPRRPRSPPTTRASQRPWPPRLRA